jgi:hypothetical protein
MKLSEFHNDKLFTIDTIDENRLAKEILKYQEISEYIEYYNNKRIKGKLKEMDHVNYKAHFLQVA